jgi:hypothetical protein
MAMAARKYPDSGFGDIHVKVVNGCCWFSGDRPDPEEALIAVEKNEDE